MIYFVSYICFMLGVGAGFIIVIFLRKDKDKEIQRELEVLRGQRHSAPSMPPNSELSVGMAKVLLHTSMMLRSKDYEYINGGLMVNEMDNGYVNIKGDLMLRSKEDVTQIQRTYIGRKNE